MKYLIFSLCLLLLMKRNGLAQNPVHNLAGISDPHIRVFKDTIFLYSGHDDKPTDSTWVMKDWRVFSTTDLVHWKYESTISPADNYMGAGSTDCWAGDAIERDGKYFFYFSDRKRSIGVMQSDRPGGGFTDVLGKPLVAPLHDPTAFIDDDSQQTPYLVYGDKGGGGYYIVRLNNDMISLAETPRAMIIKGKQWEEAGDWMDKNYFFKYKDKYYLSWGRDYAVSNNIYGPYETRGAVGQGHNLNGLAHGSFFWWKGQFYHIWCYYIKPGFKFRESVISYCHIDNEGRIVTDTRFLDQHFKNGVGRYNALWNKIEAEWYYEKDALSKKVSDNKEAFMVSGMQNGSWIRFANTDMTSASTVFTARVAGLTEQHEIEVRLDSINGPVAGRLKGVRQSREHNEYTILRCAVKLQAGERDIYIRVKSKAKSFPVTIDWISFNYKPE